MQEGCRLTYTHFSEGEDDQELLENSEALDPFRDYDDKGFF